MLLSTSWVSLPGEDADPRSRYEGWMRPGCGSVLSSRYSWTFGDGHGGQDGASRP